MKRYKVIAEGFTPAPTRQYVPLLIPLLFPQDTIEYYVKTTDTIEVERGNIYLVRDGKRYESTYRTFVVDEWVDAGCLEEIEQ